MNLNNDKKFYVNLCKMSKAHTVVVHIILLLLSSWYETDK